MRLQLATICLCAIIASEASAQESEADIVEVASDVLLYTDTDRVFVITPQVSATAPLDDEGGSVHAAVAVDSVTAASVDVVSNATYSFSEIRTQVDTAVSKKVANFLPSAHYRYSKEPDYESHSGGVGLQVDLANKDAVAIANYTYVSDTVGRVGTPTSVFSEGLTIHVAEAGITQVIGPKAVVRLVYGLTAQSGYMEKPYRYVPLFSAGSLGMLADQGIALNLDNFDRYRLGGKVPEEIPNKRYRHAFAGRGLYYIDNLDASLRLDYRLYLDSWGMQAHTLEPALTMTFREDKWLVSSWGRIHWQNSANFWQREYSVASTSSVPRYRTMDRSLSKTLHGTLGVRGEYRWRGLRTYLEGSAMYSRFFDFLLLDQRIALIAQGGVAWLF